MQVHELEIASLECKNQFALQPDPLLGCSTPSPGVYCNIFGVANVSRLVQRVNAFLQAAPQVVLLLSQLLLQCECQQQCLGRVGKEVLEKCGGQIVWLLVEEATQLAEEERRVVLIDVGLVAPQEAAHVSDHLLQ
eukprot:TRINITY_DN2139_c1_g2_i1.p1 TRINITY_DN2139_c1_g2~~TRINITY_DN2139_c1_g2_i1.p1  ORF type:complete len:135 (+),score=27.99 TRINITY_DN2139_c1_g2_i1:163-567(+)